MIFIATKWIGDAIVAVLLQAAASLFLPPPRRSLRLLQLEGVEPRRRIARCALAGTAGRKVGRKSH
jgi:hypothetical protein